MSAVPLQTDRTDAPSNGRLNPAALSIGDAARVLSRVGAAPVTVDMLEADVAAGAPANADGTINLVHYGAWLVREMAGRGD